MIEWWEYVLFGIFVAFPWALGMTVLIGGFKKFWNNRSY